ncbi:5776_t:CDS:2 [Funneliformis geosporum]|uniref:5776_t:CDS:1 n=1 Tax=Funneliformis geosporum TaxID=1117311 RepID=A0A9W4SF28_9GLOM|nr:5776_t:CDS:2 [Funneliformis geosporum]
MSMKEDHNEKHQNVLTITRAKKLNAAILVRQQMKEQLRNNNLIPQISLHLSITIKPKKIH